MTHNIDDDSLVIFCPCWGQKHLDMLRRFALPSLMQPGNLPACGYKHVSVYGSTIGDTLPLSEVLSGGLSGLPRNISVVNSASDRGATLGVLKLVIRHCIYHRQRMLLLMPDTIIANGGVFNMREYARGKPVSVAAPHLRVTTEGSDKLAFALSGASSIRPTSKHLVAYAFNHPHQSTTDSFSDRDNGTHMGGISLTRISDQLTTIMHYLPTVYLAWFTESDAAFFSNATAFRDWDHCWPKHLADEGRLRVVSDSDFFFAVELTDPGMNLVEVKPGSRLEEHSENGLLSLKPFVGTLKS